MSDMVDADELWRELTRLAVAVLALSAAVSLGVFLLLNVIVDAIPR